MSHLPFTLLAYFLNSISVTINKVLLRKDIPDPFVYIFYVSIFSLVILPAVFFTPAPNAFSFTLASASTLFWTLGAYFLFKALKSGQISRVIPVIGTILPLILFFYAAGTSSITLNQTWAIFFLVLGLVFITLTDWKGKFSKEEFLYEIFSSFFFAFSYILLRQAYLNADFFSVLVYSRLILIPLVLFVILTPLRKKVLVSQNQTDFKKSGIIFLLGQASGGASELLLLFSISLTTPALVNSLQGTQYIFLLVFGIFLKEKYSKTSFFTKLLGIILIALGLYILAFPQIKDEPKLGVTFSPKYAMQLNLNPQTTFIKLLDELKVKSLRLPVYWDEVETFPREFNFSRIDFYIEEAQKKGVEVVLILGYKQPRWPECFAPVWVDNLMASEKEERILDLVKREVEHFKKYTNITAWQVENEPYFPYGECKPKVSRILQKEVEIVRSLDERPVIITDAGEPGLWVPSIKAGDVFGTTLYRQVWGPLFGQQTYPLPPIFYRLKWQLAEALSGKSGGKAIISELQAEPWIPSQIATRGYPVEEQSKLMPVSKIEGNIEYAKETGFEQIYLWGVEWWYFMASQGHPEYLEKAKGLLYSSSERNKQF